MGSEMCIRDSRSIYDQYLQGASLRMIKLSLEGKAVPNPTGGAKWDISQIRSILGNEKYCGDVLMQKTFTQDCINKKVIKNTGQFPMYLIQNNHPAIVSREIYRAVQAEKTRRSASASPSKKTSSTDFPSAPDVFFSSFFVKFFSKPR